MTAVGLSLTAAINLFFFSMSVSVFSMSGSVGMILFNVAAAFNAARVTRLGSRSGLGFGAGGDRAEAAGSSRAETEAGGSSGLEAVAAGVSTAVAAGVSGAEAAGVSTAGAGGN